MAHKQVSCQLYLYNRNAVFSLKSLKKLQKTKEVEEKIYILNLSLAYWKTELIWYMEYMRKSSFGDRSCGVAQYARSEDTKVLYGISNL